MSHTEELKNLLHESIENIDDDSFLEAVKQLLDRKYEPEKEIMLSPYQEKRIQDARQSIKQGDYLSNEQADRLVAEWLNK